ncbi:MAG: ATP phosphoribosyltransferase [Chloroflexota bacterium]
MPVEKLRFALPSKGRMQDPALDFMQLSGLRVARPNPRQYTASIRGVPAAQVIFQRSKDVYRQVNAGTVDAGIIGLNDYAEQRHENDDSVLVIDDLGFGRCELLLAVPSAWAEVNSLADLAALARQRGAGRPLRVATQYPNLVGSFLRAGDVPGVQLETGFEGTLEMAPAMDTADLIADLSETGTSIKENQLKPLEGGTILKSQACLIGNRRTLASGHKLETARCLLELMEASLRAQDFYSLIANVAGESAEAVAGRIVQRPELAGLTGPTISPVYPKSGKGHWFAVNVVVDHARLITAIDHLREIGATGMEAIPTKYVFEDRCRAFERLVAEVQR